MVKTVGILVVLFIIALLLTVRNEIAYYAQSISGHWDVMRRSRPIAELLADPALDGTRRARLETVTAARDFASTALALPDNGSYRKFADIERPFVVWNVVAAPEFSLEARQWCFPVAGCVSYRGYFDEAAARREAGRLEQEGFETDLYGVPAYSTLNWFADPVLNTFLDGPELNAAALIFHELAHQVVYVRDDSRFNEAFATTVELEGVRRWLQARGSAGEWQDYLARTGRAQDFQALLRATREQLAKLYAGAAPDDEKRRRRGEILAATERAYVDLKGSWGGYAGYDGWMARGLNNARLASAATYHDLVPAFQGLLAAAGGDLPGFYARVRELAALPPDERLVRLDGYAKTVQVTTGS